VGSCAGCGRPLCLACAIPVRGTLVGAECLTAVVEDAPSVGPAPSAPVSTLGDHLVIAGFGLVVLLSIFPWSRFGGSSGFLGAWSLHWSLISVAAAVVGLALALVRRHRSLDPRLEAGSAVSLSVIVAVSAILYRLHPPLLSRASLVPSLAVVGAVIALTGGIMKTAVVVRARWMWR
jgi:hypothetical protein